MADEKRVPDPAESLRRVLRIHHPIMRSETGPLSGCRCGMVKLGQDVIQHVVTELTAAVTAPVSSDLAWLNDLERAHAEGSRTPWSLLGGTHDRDVLDDHGCHVAASGTIPDAALIVAAVNRLPELIAELRKRDAALRGVLAVHAPIEWQECDEEGVPNLDKPLPPFCSECTDVEYVNAVEFGDTIDRGSPVVTHPCRTAQMVTAALSPESVQS